MRGFYDRILPKAVAKWAKPFGAKVAATTINTQGRGLGERRAYVGPVRTIEEIQSAIATVDNATIESNCAGQSK
jgi:hypothetical protein